MSQQKSNKKLAFALTNLSYQAAVGTLALYSMTKNPMADLFSYNEDFLGILQSLMLAGETLGSLFVLFLPLNPIKAFLIFAILNGMFSILMFMPRHIHNQIIRDFALGSCFFCQSFFLSSLAYSQIIFSYYFDQNSDKSEHSVWYCLTFLGDLVSIIFCQVLLHYVGLEWQMVRFLWHLYIIIVGVLMYKRLKYNYSGQNQIQEMLDNEGFTLTEAQKKSIKFQIRFLCGKITQILKQLNILMVIISFGLIQTMYDNLLFWVPYYFIVIGYESYAMPTIFFITVSISFGGMITQLIIFKMLKMQKNRISISYILILCSSIMYVILIFNKLSGPRFQLLIIVLANLFLSTPYSNISTNQVIQQCGYNQKKINTTFLLCHLCRNLVNVIFVLVIGFSMNRNQYTFWNIMLYHIILVILVQTVRTFCLKKPPSPTQPQNNNEIQMNMLKS